MIKNVANLVLLCILFAGCTDQITNITDLKVYNLPSVGNAQNSFGYALSASAFTSSEDYQLSFSGTELVLGLTVSDYSNGSFEFQIFGSDSSAFYSLQLTNDIALGETTISGTQPLRIKILFNNFSGDVSLGLSKKNQ